MAKHVYFFGEGTADGDAGMKALLGGKGANLAEMSKLGIPVPPGFTITTEVCAHYSARAAGGANEAEGDLWPEGLRGEVEAAVARVGRIMGFTLGDRRAPLLVSVRSGARASMPGMMDTILNLGLNDATVEALAAATGNPRFSWDSYRRFVEMYGSVVLGIERAALAHPGEARAQAAGARAPGLLAAEDLRAVVGEMKGVVRERAGREFPEDAGEQLWGAIAAVFRSWNNPRAHVYRRMYGIPESWGTACNVQAMVFGNMGEDSGTGVAFSRDPSTGERRLYGEFLPDAQGEDVVAGIRTPLPIAEMERVLPEAYRAFREVAERLDRHYRDVQDMEFTVQKGRLWMLQTRVAKRSAHAMFKVAVDLVREGLIDERTAVDRMEPDKTVELFLPQVDPCPPPGVEAIARGLAASPAGGVGRVVFSANDARAWADRGEKVILVRVETSPDDLHGMQAAQGILTARGGLTSHAAVVARGMGKCCVTGADIAVDYARREFRAGERTVREGDSVTVCGAHGVVFEGRRETRLQPPPDEYRAVQEWADRFARMKVRANADTPEDARRARSLGARGIGLCRTEHMFFDAGRILAVREMLLAEDEEGRDKALSRIVPMQRADFAGIFREMDGLPVTIRLLDPPLHEFLPHTDAEIRELLEVTGRSEAALRKRAEQLHEANPMLGHRGCRLGLTYPEIYRAQARAILQAACDVAAEGRAAIPEIMIPLVGHEEELRRLRGLVIEEAEAVFAERGRRVAYTVGTMIELPRACLVADRIAASADFFSFGTNDLTQTTFGLSRDDAGRFLPFYVENKLLPGDPFVAIDRDGVGELVRIGVAKGRSLKPDLKIGVCGEHGGEPGSIRLWHDLGFDYVSCSPFRVPVARLAAAQAAIRAGGGGGGAGTA